MSQSILDFHGAQSKGLTATPPGNHRVVVPLARENDPCDVEMTTYSSHDGVEARLSIEEVVESNVVQRVRFI